MAISILLVRLRQIGDVVFTTPAVRAIREHFPTAHITYLVEPGAAPVVTNNSRLDEVLVAPRWRGARHVLHEAALIRRLRARKFDLAIDFHGGPRASLLTWLSGAPTRVGYDVVGRSWMYTTCVPRARALTARHSVANQCDLLQPLGIPAPEPGSHPVEMPADSKAATGVRERLETAGVRSEHRVIAIHVSAGNPFRRWPIASFAQVAATLAANDERHRIVLTSGPSERAAVDQVIQEARARLPVAHAARVVASGEFTLAELRALADRASLYIGGDSGPLHIAATTDVPIVGLYGPTLPARSAPWRKADSPSESLEVPGLPCRPCDQRVCAPGDFRCLAWIRPEQVVEAATRLLERCKMEPPRRVGQAG